MTKTKISLLFLSTMFILSSCSSVKLASKDVVNDPVYATKADVEAAILSEKVAIERSALENGSAKRQGKKSASATGKYDYMPASSYSERFNRTGNSFFLADRHNQSFYGNRYNSQFNGGMMSMGAGGMNFGSMFNPHFSMNSGFNRMNDPFMSYYMMRSNSPYPFFTYNPYMYSFSLLNNSYDPWMMGNSNPYFFNPYYSYNPYGFNNSYCPYSSTFSTASKPTYVTQRRNSSVGNSSSSSRSSGSSSTGSSRTSSSSYNTSTSDNTQRNTTFGNSGSGTSRGGYNSNSSGASRGTSGSSGSKRR